MTFNVENLFDNTHDAGKNDETYLPPAKNLRFILKNVIGFGSSMARPVSLLGLERYSSERKLNVIADSIKQINRGQGPDIIAFPEIENILILERLRNEHLSGLGYQPVC